MTSTVAAVAIGRNEGDRLIACLESMFGQLDRIIYVDSGSTDNSVAEARARGADVVELDMSIPFTAARARNAGVARLAELGERPDYIQFLDGDCILQEGWIETGRAFLDTHADVAAVAGRNRERFPERSLYNALADIEWSAPAGQSKASGGNVMMRRTALEETGGFDERLIAGEEPELCLRMRQAGWKIWRLDTEMTLHDANLMHFSQWWQRGRRCGYAITEGAVMHGRDPERYQVPALVRIVLWGLVLPLVILIGVAFTPWALVLVLLWPARIIRRLMKGDPWFQAVFIILAKFPEAQGVLTYLWRRFKGTNAQLIEHK